MLTVACFAVFFDPHKGNVLEWSDMGEQDAHLLHNLEMLVMGPGFQNRVSDYVLFGVPNTSLFGAAAFSLMRTAVAEERYGRMRSVGVVGTNLLEIRRLVPTLYWLAKSLNEHPADYSLLVTFSAALKGMDSFDEPSVRRVCGGSADTDVTGYAPAIHDPIFFVLLQSILCHRRVILYSKQYAGMLCDLAHQLISHCLMPTTLCSPVRVMQYLLYRTIYFEQELRQMPVETHSWLITTTDASLVLLRPIEWEVLLVLHWDGEERISDDNFLITGSKVNSIRRVFMWNNHQVFATLYFAAACDIRLYRGVRFRETEKIWGRIFDESKANIEVDTQAVNYKFTGVQNWSRNIFNAIIEQCENYNISDKDIDHEPNTEKDIILRRTIFLTRLSTLCKKYGIVGCKREAQWFLLWCEVMGICVFDDTCTSFGLGQGCFPRRRSSISNSGATHRTTSNNQPSGAHPLKSQSSHSKKAVLPLSRLNI